MDEVIQVNGLCKSYKISKRSKGVIGNFVNLFYPKLEIKKAISDLNFVIKKGEAVGFIGPNGAGKSTTIKVLSGILYPDGGTITVAGVNPFEKRVKFVSKIGVVFGQKTQLNWDLPVIDSFELLKSIYKIPEDEYKKNLELFIDLLKMEDFIYQPVRQLSLGQRMRADIAAALLHSPEIVFLDEPTIGLDIVAKESIREFIKEINKKKKVTIIFTTHDIQDIVSTCRRIIIIDKGKLIFDGTVEQLINKYDNRRKLIVKLEHDIDITEFAIEKVKVEYIDSEEISFSFEEDGTKLSEIISMLNEKYVIKDLNIEKIEIEEIIKEIYEKGV